LCLCLRRLWVLLWMGTALLLLLVSVRTIAVGGRGRWWELTLVLTGTGRTYSFLRILLLRMLVVLVRIVRILTRRFRVMLLLLLLGLLILGILRRICAIRGRAV